MTIPYGFKKMVDGNVRMIASEIGVVQRIYQRYVDGASLGGIAAELEADQVVAPSGNPKWSRFVIDKILSNGKQSACKFSPAISDIALKELICKELGLVEFDEQAVRDNISQALIAPNGEIGIVRKF